MLKKAERAAALVAVALSELLSVYSLNSYQVQYELYQQAV